MRSSPSAILHPRMNPLLHAYRHFRPVLFKRRFHAPRQSLVLVTPPSLPLSSSFLGCFWLAHPADSAHGDLMVLTSCQLANSPPFSFPTLPSPQPPCSSPRRTPVGHRLCRQRDYSSNLSPSFQPPSPPHCTFPSSPPRFSPSPPPSGCSHRSTVWSSPLPSSPRLMRSSSAGQSGG